MISIYVISILSVIFFSFCAHYFIKVLVSPGPKFNATEYSRLALKCKRAYSIFAWGLMSTTFLIALTVSFYQVFVEW
jgi:hypothetical protein